MATKIKGIYQGQLTVELEHELSRSKIQTTAPLDNGGTGEKFSPTDLVAGALGSCMVTVMGIVAQRHHLDLTGTYFSIEKEMIATPRRIGTLTVAIHMPKGLKENDRKLLERTAQTCPVKESLHADVVLNITYHYDVD